MDEHSTDLPFEMTVAIGKVRLYWRLGRCQLSLVDKHKLFEAILEV